MNFMGRRIPHTLVVLTTLATAGAVTNLTGCSDSGSSDDEVGDTVGTDSDTTSESGTETAETDTTSTDDTDTSTDVDTEDTETETDTTTGIPPCPYDPVDGDPNLTLEVVAEGLSGPTCVVADPQDPQRLFICEKGGLIRIVEPGTTTPNADPFLSIDVADFSEMGLLGFTFHPDYPDDPRIYVHYSPDAPQASRVSEFMVSGGVAEPSSERILWERPQSQGNHNGGDITFGPDGYLYFTIGDGGEQGDPNNRAQDLSTYYGKIMRVDVTPSGGEQFSIPADNPFVNDGNALPEIYAYGLRNPWRMSFDSATGDMYVGDVGQNEWEEIDIVTSGGNYGWVPMEGNHCFDQFDCDTSAGPNEANIDGYIAPIIDYGGQQRSVTGGFVYHSCEVPAWDGRYFYADWVLDTMWALTWDGSTVTDHGVVANPSSVTSFGTNGWGDVYVVQGNFGFQPPHPSNSVIWRIAPE